MKRNTLKKCGGGFLVGAVNGLFGAGGGIVAVPMLRKFGVSDKSAHASSVALIFPLSVVSFLLYLFDGRVAFSDGLPYLLPGVGGAVLGTVLLSKIPAKWLHRVFGCFVIFAGVRMMLK